MAPTCEDPAHDHFRWRYCPNCGFEIAKQETEPRKEQKHIDAVDSLFLIDRILDGFSPDELEEFNADPQRDIKFLKLLAECGHGQAQILLDHNGWFLKLLAYLGTFEAYKVLKNLEIPYEGTPTLIRMFQESQRKAFLKKLGMPTDAAHYYGHNGPDMYHDYTYEDFGLRLYALPKSYPCSLPYIRSDKAIKSNRKPREVTLKFPMNYGTYGKEFIMYLRRRVFYLDSPAFIEELWHPERGYSMTLRGLELIPDTQDRIEIGKILLNGLVESGGRPKNTGYFSNKRSLEEALQKAFTAIRKRGRRITQSAVADYFSSQSGLPNCSARQIRRWLERFDMDWNELLSRF